MPTHEQPIWRRSWHWPVRVGILPSDGVDTEALLAELRSASHVKRKLAHVGLFGRDLDSADILLVIGSPGSKALDALDGRVGAIVFDNKLRKQWAADTDLEAIVKNTGAGAAAQLRLGERRPGDWFNELIAELSHGNPLTVALTKSSQKSSFYCAPGFDQYSNIRAAIESLSDRIMRTPQARRIVFPKISSYTFNLPDKTGRLVDILEGNVPTGAIDPVPQKLGNVFRQKSVDFGLLRETHEATGVAALEASVRDTETGSRVRAADVTFFEADGETRVHLWQQLVMDEPYRLEFAFRVQRSGIGFDQNIEPMRSSSKGTATLHVALAIGDGCKGEIPDAVGTIELPPDGDSTEAWFTFIPHETDNGIFRLDIRVYYRLNLLEHVIVESGYHTDPMHRVLQPEQFRRHDGELEELFAPARISIDVGPAPQFRLTVASPDERGLRLSALPTIGGEGLRTAIAEMRELWLDVAFGPFANGVAPSTNASAREKVGVLAKKGRELWAMLFDRGEAGGEAEQLGRALKTAQYSPDTSIHINVGEMARPFVFPWTMLYDREPASGGEVDLEGFWGMRFNIEQRPTTRFRIPVTGAEPGAVTAALFLDTRIRQSNGQRALVRDLAEAAGNRLALADPIESRDGLLAALEANRDHLFYFYCHGMTKLNSGGLLEVLRGYTRQPDSAVAKERLSWVFANKALKGSDTAILLTRDLVKLNDLWVRKTELEREPIVVLNMCESAQLLPDLTDSFVQYFLSCRASAVVGTECVIPADFAAAFGCELLPRLLNDVSVGHALLDARRRMMRDYRNPLGLAYTLWGNASARLKPVALAEGEGDKYFYKEGSTYV